MTPRAARSSSWPILRVLALLWVAVVSITGPVRAETPEYVQQILREAKARAVKVPAQVRALIGLAWPGEEGSDPRVQAAARESLVRYGSHALPELRRALPDLDTLYQGDAIAAFIEARYRNPQGMPPDFLPGLEEAIWFGSAEAQRIALNEIKRYVFPPAVLSSIDAAYNEPILTRYVVNSLAVMRDPRARPFLTDLLIDGADLYKGAAARALEAFGERSVDNFRAGVLADDSTARATAMRIFLPLSEVGDLELLKAYLANRTEDDPELREAVRKRVAVLERRQAP